MTHATGLVASRSNICTPALVGGTTLLYNVYTGSLLELDEEEVAFVEGWVTAAGTSVPTNMPEQLLSALRTSGAIVPAGFDEVATMERLRAHRMHEHLLLTVAPTMQCNFACGYCFESHAAIYMSDEVEDALRRFTLKRMASVKSVNIVWFGGEPLLYPERIASFQKFINDAAAAANVPVSKSMITNGYLLDGEKIELLKSLGQWSQIQITLDGSEESHNRRRLLRGGQGTWDRIVANIGACLDAGLRIGVRANIDRRNVDQLRRMVDRFEEMGFLGRIGLHLGFVTGSTDACTHVEDFTLTTSEFARASLWLKSELMRRGYRSGAQLPRPRCESLCTADTKMGFVVGPTGLLFKCWHQVHMSREEAVGHLSGSEVPNAKANLGVWESHSPLAKTGCRECSVAAACMGGCAWENMRRGGDRGVCGELKHFPEQVVALAHAERVVDNEESRS